MPFEEIFNFFFERHIVLKEDWLRAVLTSLRKSGINSKFFDAVYEQWLYSDLADSTYPIFSEVGISNDSKNTITMPFVAQITSVVDVGSSLYSQYKMLTYEFIDNSGFDALPEQENPNEFSKPKRMLSLTISDGVQSVRAIEHFSIPQANLLLTPGCKVLLLPNIVSRKGLLLLKSTNLQILGGDVEHLMKTGRPLDVMCSLLAITPKPREVKSSDNEANAENYELSNAEPVNRELNRTLLQPSSSSRNIYLQDDDFDDSTDDCSPPSEVQKNALNRLMKSQGRGPTTFGRKSVIIEEQRSPEVLGSLLSVTRTKQRNKSSIIEVKENPSAPKQSQTPRGCLSTVTIKPNTVVRLEDSPPNFETECPDYLPRRPDFTVNSRITRKRSFVLSKHSDHSPSQYPLETSLSTWTSQKAIEKKEPEKEIPKTKELIETCDLFSTNTQNLITIPERVMAKSPPPKKIANSTNIQRTVKLEIIDLSDDEIVSTSPAQPTLLSSLPSPVLSAITASPVQPTVQANGFLDELCTGSMSSVYSERFGKLKIMKLEQASRQSRFVVGSIRCKVQAVVIEIKEALRIVDNVWTQKVLLMDESSTVTCYIDNETLVTLIGLTTEQAMEIKRSTDSVRRKEGTRRLAAVSTQMQRLDLLFEVEFYSEGLAEAVVRSVQTLPQALEVLF